MHTIIALDLGAKNVGVALTRSGKITATVGVWPRRPQTAFLLQLRELIETEQAEFVVIGLPSKATRSVKLETTSFAHEVERLGVITAIIEEDFTTNEAQTKTKQTKNHADAEAAEIILARYLEDQA